MKDRKLIKGEFALVTGLNLTSAMLIISEDLLLLNKSENKQVYRDNQLSDLALTQRARKTEEERVWG